MTAYQHLLLFGSVVVAACFLVVYFWPRIMLFVYKRAILVQGFGEGPIPVNTLYTEPEAVFADPLRAAPASGSKLITTGVNRDTLLMVGWLDLRNGPQVLHVPDMGGRYYSVQLTDPSNNTNFAYVGKRVTGTEAGDYLVSGPGWRGSGPQRMTRISSPNNSVACSWPHARRKRRGRLSRVRAFQADPSDTARRLTTLRITGLRGRAPRLSVSQPSSHRDPRDHPADPRPRAVTDRAAP